MTKEEFLSELEHQLDGLSESERKKSLEYYDEMITDATEDGMSESDAVAAVGDVGGIARQIRLDAPLTSIIKTKVRENKEKSGNKTLWTVLLIAGSPVWAPVLFAFVCAALALYIAVWAVVVSLYAVELSLSVAALAYIAASVYYCATGFVPLGLCAAGAGMILAAIVLFTFKPLILLTKQVARLAGTAVRGTKRCIIGRKGTNNEG